MDLDHTPISRERHEDGTVTIRCSCGLDVSAVSVRQAKNAYHRRHIGDVVGAARRERKRYVTGPESGSKRPVDEGLSAPLHRMGVRH